MRLFKTVYKTKAVVLSIGGNVQWGEHPIRYLYCNDLTLMHRPVVFSHRFWNQLLPKLFLEQICIIPDEKSIIKFLNRSDYEYPSIRTMAFQTGYLEKPDTFHLKRDIKLKVLWQKRNLDTNETKITW